MRVLLDTNVLISYLLSARPEHSATSAILRLAFTGQIVLLHVPGVIEELQWKLKSRPDLATRINPASAAALVEGLRTHAESVQPLPEPYPEVTRDPKDDYLIAHAIVAEADFLASWDRDLLDLHEIGGVRIVSPPELLAHLRGELPRSGHACEVRYHCHEDSDIPHEDEPMPHSTAIRIEQLTDDELDDSLTTSPQAAEWKGIIVSDPQTASGRPRVNGTRLTVECILNLFAAGWTEAQVPENYPALSREALRAVFANAAAQITSSPTRRPTAQAG